MKLGMKKKIKTKIKNYKNGPKPKKKCVGEK